MPKRTNMKKFLLLFLALTVRFSHCESSIRSYEVEDDDLQQHWLDQDGFNTLFGNDSGSSSCDITKGKWVFDQTYPLYDATDCPYLSSPVACRKNGRPDSDYEKLKWKPHHCSIPRFNALEFLGRMRRKRIMLVGDSIMRNQWESLVCLVQSVVPAPRKTLIYNGPTMAFLALDYEMSIEFCWAPLLVELKRGAGGERILHLDSIEENAKYWRRVNLLIFDSAHWWARSDDKHTSSWDLVMEENKVYRSINPTIAYEKGLTTWAKWIDLNLDPRRTKVIFRTMSPRHNNRQNGWKCYNQRQPLEYFSRSPSVPKQSLVLRKVTGRMAFPVIVQDITTMSTFRRDGHPSIYTRATRDKSAKKLKDRSNDCSHWCLPGVPDAWNEMLNAMLLQD